MISLLLNGATNSTQLGTSFPFSGLAPSIKAILLAWKLYKWRCDSATSIRCRFISFATPETCFRERKASDTGETETIMQALLEKAGYERRVCGMHPKLASAIRDIHKNQRQKEDAAFQQLKLRFHGRVEGLGSFTSRKVSTDKESKKMEEEKE